VNKDEIDDAMEFLRSRMAEFYRDFFSTTEWCYVVGS